jgi:hypothetical protein
LFSPCGSVFFAVVADFVVRRFEPSLYQPFLWRQAAYLFEIALENGKAATGSRIVAEILGC